MSSPTSVQDDEYATRGYVQQILQGLGADTVELRNKAIQAAVQGLDTVEARRQAISAAVQGLDTTSARQQAITQAVSGLVSAQALDTVAAKIPAFSPNMPMSEATAGAPGSMPLVPHADHQHPRLSSTGTGTLRTNNGADTGAGALVPGDAVVMFTRTFEAKPGITVIAIDDDTDNPVPRFKVKRWLKADGTLWSSGFYYGGCVIYGQRDRALPTLASIGVLSLLTTLITTLNSLLAPLSGYKAYEPAAGTSFTLIALQQSSAS